MILVIPKFAEWPQWLQWLVIAPNGLLLGIATWLWWPKDERGWRRFGVVLAYLVVFYLVMIYVFDFK
jgi:CHASE2 domain-containing sensor protein